jgi:hypothetical protein
MLSLFVFVVAVVAVEVRFNATHSATFTIMADTASLALNVTIDQLYLNVNSDSNCSLCFGDGKEEILIELKDVRLLLPLRAQGALVRNATLPLSGASICSSTIWDPAEPDEPAVATLRTPLRLVPNRVVDIALTASWADRVAFSSFEAPMIGFSALGFESDSGTTLCNNTASSDELHSGTFSNLRLCSQENRNCSALIGSANDGYVYWGPKPQYGARVVPSWSWSGTRRLARPAPSQAVDVAALRSTSDIAASAVVSASSCPEFEMSAVELRSGSGLLFHVNMDGDLRRSLLAETVAIAAGAVFVLQFDEALKAVNSSTTDVQLQFLTLVRTVGQFGIEANATPQLAVANAPEGWEVLASQFRLSSTGDHVSLNVTVGDPKRAMIVTSLSSETLPPAPSFRCVRNCAGHGLCVGEEMCSCTNGWVNDPNRGCADPIEFVTQPPQTNTVAVKSNVVDDAATAAATTTTTSISANAIGETTSTTSAQLSTTPTTSDLSSSATNMVASTPTPTDNTPLIAGAVGGSLLFLALVALVVFLVRRRKSAAVDARASQPSELRSGNQYQAVRVRPPSVAYDVGQLERPPGDDYSQLQIKPNSNYDVVDAEEPRYAELSILAPDSATRGIVATDTGVGKNYGRL